MDHEEFTPEAPGDLVDTVIDGQTTSAFVPDDLTALQRRPRRDSRFFVRPRRLESFSPV